MPTHTRSSIRPAVLLTRLWFAALGRLAPRRAERQAARLFLTPRRPRARRHAEQALAHGGARLERLVVEAGGRRLTGWSVGAGPAVLLLHGWSGAATDMAPMALALARAGFRAVAFDLPAHGGSPGRRTSMAEWLRVLPALAAHAARAAGGVRGGLHAVIGHSLGGAALALALEAGLDARGAVLVASPLGPRYFLERIRRFLGLGERHAAGMERAVVAMVGRELDFFDAARAAASLRVPAMVFHDPGDREVPWSDAQAIVRAWRGSELAAVGGVGHTRILATPSVIARVVRFVSTLRDVPARETAAA